MNTRAIWKNKHALTRFSKYPHGYLIPGVFRNYIKHYNHVLFILQGPKIRNSIDNVKTSSLKI